MMSEDERERLRLLPSPPAEGTQMRRAVDLRASGMPYQDIADELEIDVSRAMHYVTEGLERFLAEEIRHADVARHLHVERLRALLQAQWPIAMTGHEGATNVCLKIMEREARLLGLDAPVKVDVEHSVRQLAIDNGLDPDEAVEEARRLVKELPR